MFRPRLTGVQITPIRKAGRIPTCTNHRRGQHRWAVEAVVHVAVFDGIPPSVKLRCTRCDIGIAADVRVITRPLLPKNRRRAAHAATTKGTHR
jgi:hypothetical protein